MIPQKKVNQRKHFIASFLLFLIALIFTAIELFSTAPTEDPLPDLAIAAPLIEPTSAPITTLALAPTKIPEPTDADKEPKAAPVIMLGEHPFIDIN